jgi:hypothetical protein
MECMEEKCIKILGRSTGMSKLLRRIILKLMLEKCFVREKTGNNAAERVKYLTYLNTIMKLLTAC